jgi:hypothetical protein
MYEISLYKKGLQIGFEVVDSLPEALVSLIDAAEREDEKVEMQVFNIDSKETAIVFMDGNIIEFGKSYFIQ